MGFLAGSLGAHLLGARPEWIDHARCRDMNPDLFFPDRGEPTRVAKAACRECPVRAECLAMALDERERFGIWGGYSERERRTFRRRLANGVPMEVVVAEAIGRVAAVA